MKAGGREEGRGEEGKEGTRMSEKYQRRNK
jgi:hypothetical protein